MNNLIIQTAKKMPNLFEIAYSDRGNVPAELSGFYSSRRNANLAISRYVPKPPPTPMVYAHGKNITDEEEAEMALQVKLKVEELNSGKEERAKTED